ncbi:non-ribosomal peptide synthetase [Xenorhabdus bovienii]|uniref:non-ribosomal peptide synthetase n=1 Tax=Xenorhabdus bovienii TaxID=40576 RepID=UPI00237CB375|nr:non-ribosomal peptide synthetase [Xenorhabdus bovienii]MDE1485746.1 non-ribosomal peptide synthetase [Xenorhabdus bovienii]MDE1495086.1 non-ribosomal peptide synthetase [Xenorhabdus bovienii]MDE9473137.1 non-ribosomal peptide synthetase [Xenorhabdus bovienii]MDE9476551.1 non-ribosomal peptide synthetase [Xenorhabdus bovienii]MDE9529333.1 non-ribosomal peptide synthetase [Xenorhabdus bovienii]
MLVVDTSLTPSLNARLESTAKNFANRLAVQDENRALTFADFYNEVKLLSARLQTLIQPGDHVAVQLKRGLDYIVAAYAIWQAGGVYLPLDDQWPQSRIEGILHQAHVQVLIHTSNTGHSLTLTTLTPEPRAELSVIGTPAYIIHTSGTTGTPKGVVVSHESLLHLVDSHQRNIYQPHGVTKGHVVVNASFCFDSSLERLALVALGYSVHVVSDQVRKSPFGLVNYLHDHHIVNIDLVPSHLKILLNAGLDETCDALQLLIVGGEAINTELWLKLAASKKIYINVYGPTENTINTTFCKIKGEIPHIGQPFENVVCLILDENEQPCLPGTAGELLVAGSHLSLGYYNAPILTSRAFVTFNGQRYYRTGDLVQENEQKNLLFLGRIDDQVKINGYRIELADVQHHLAQLPSVQYAAVTPIKLPSGHALLASIVWYADVGNLTFTDLAKQLSQKLPAYMIPEYWQQLDTLPLTDNLKLDHKSLLNHWQNHQNKSNETATEDPISTTEHQIRCLWQQILMRESLSLDDHFFSAGGNSMTAMTLLIELNKVTPHKVGLADIFKYPTIRKMAAWLNSPTEKTEAQ